MAENEDEDEDGVEEDRFEDDNNATLDDNVVVDEAEAETGESEWESEESEELEEGIFLNFTKQLKEEDEEEAEGEGEVICEEAAEGIPMFNDDVLWADSEVA